MGSQVLPMGGSRTLQHALLVKVQVMQDVEPARDVVGALENDSGRLRAWGQPLKYKIADEGPAEAPYLLSGLFT